VLQTNNFRSRFDMVSAKTGPKSLYIQIAFEIGAILLSIVRTKFESLCICLKRGNTSWDVQSTRLGVTRRSVSSMDEIQQNRVWDQASLCRTVLCSNRIDRRADETLGPHWLWWCKFNGTLAEARLKSCTTICPHKVRAE
jgi:hypothetical protein